MKLIESTKKMVNVCLRNWMTTSAGVLIAVAGVMAKSPESPLWVTDAARFVVTVGPVALGFFATDAVKKSE